MGANHTWVQKGAAWAVHIFTSLGIVCSFFAILAVQEHNWRIAMFWLIVALVVDGIDGTFARMANVREVLPFLDGKNIDYVVDFVNYAVIPAYMFYEVQIVPSDWNLSLTLLILIVSALYYGRDKMVSDDNYFIGFPVLWNLVLFYYIFISNFASFHYIWITILIAILHFVPIKMAYPTQNNRMKVPTIAVTIVLFTTMIVSVYLFPSKPLWVIIFAYMALVYFVLLCAYDTFRSK